MSEEKGGGLPQSSLEEIDLDKYYIYVEDSIKEEIEKHIYSTSKFPNFLRLSDLQKFSKVIILKKI